jgi:hypothetical protein
VGGGEGGRKRKIQKKGREEGNGKERQESARGRSKTIFPLDGRRSLL